MPATTCARCFAVHDSDDARPGSVPGCPACRTIVGTTAVLAGDPAVPPARASGAVLRRLGLATLALLLAAALGGACWVGLPAAWRRFQAWRAPPAEQDPQAVAQAVAAWRAAGKLPASGASSDAAALLQSGEAGLAADTPARARAALGDFRAALAADPARVEAVAGYATALVEARTELLDGAELLRAHAVLREVTARVPGDARLQAAYARLLLAVPSPSNRAEAARVAEGALAAAPGDAGVQLAAGLCELQRHPAAAAAALTAAARAHPGDRRLLTAACRSRWASGDAPGARALARERLALDPDHGGALELLAETELALDRPHAARAALDRWAVADPRAATPLLLAARNAYQLEGDLPAAARLLDQALARHPDDFEAARILAHRAAVARASGDPAGARAAVGEALRRVPGNGPARFQEALLAHAAGDLPALRLAAGVVAEGGGPRVQLLLAARVAELGDLDEAERAYRALARPAARDPAALLAVAGGLLRLRASGLALQLADEALRRDPLDGRLRRMPTDFWEGPAPVAEASSRLAALAAAEPPTARRALAAAACAELVLGHTREAERLARGAQQASPQSALPLAIRAQVALDTGERAAAARLAQAALQAGPGEPLVLVVGARALAATGQPDEAERLLRAALAAAPDLATARLDLARLLEARGARGEARDTLAALVREEPEIPAARAALAALQDAPAPP
ncbi:MAG: tetratricopeptide repeat protein [Anaeromyxobacter sp.]